MARPTLPLAEHLTPIIWRRKDGYMFSDDPADWIEYEKKQLLLSPACAPPSPSWPSGSPAPLPPPN
ncbi:MULTISPECIES: hypothetical protein [unclassified Streptomyces]|uniref:hypothetical protein n=1 Tax=unclassified Streptomyces TaxID=2593676 RepID=UPI000DAE97F1|nr:MULTISPECIES: hypothetical protein [unclassified Streptomyces]PZT71768.1 hypothetical protein DNK55_32065 [Streptomyces sp. AC1-42T]PZT73107.1 hypothetical protein DNK56_33010 [Streptomyces sp. AC1-42W]